MKIDKVVVKAVVGVSLNDKCGLMADDPVGMMQRKERRLLVGLLSSGRRLMMMELFRAQSRKLRRDAEYMLSKKEKGDKDISGFNVEINSSITGAKRTKLMTAAVVAGLTVAITMFVVGLFLIKILWTWTVPDLFPGAVQQGLIAKSISWFAAAKIALFIAILAGIVRGRHTEKKD